MSGRHLIGFGLLPQQAPGRKENQEDQEEQEGDQEEQEGVKEEQEGRENKRGRVG